MLRNLTLLSAVFLLNLCPVAANSQDTMVSPKSVKVDGSIEWVYDYAEGVAASAQSGKPLFVVIRCER